ncbi:MAG: lycopene cyclase domain-containing protein, partial [Flavobacteriales bacterium]
MWYEFNGLYLAVNLGCLALPLLLSFDKNVQFYKQWKYFFRVNLSVAAFFIVWDVIFTKMGIWAFNPDYLLGPSILGLPFEELLFFVCIPYCSVFTYFSLQHYVKRNPLKHAETTLTISAI